MRIAAGDLVTSCVRNRGTGGTVKGLGKEVSSQLSISMIVGHTEG